MMLSVPTTCSDDRSNHVCTGSYLNFSKSPKGHIDTLAMDDDDDNKSSIVSAFEFWSDADDSCSETEPASFSMSSYSSLLGPNMNAGRVSATLNDSWCEKDETKHFLNNDEIELLINALQYDDLNSEESKATKKKSKRKDKESEKLKKKKKGSTKSSSTKSKTEKKKVRVEKKSRRKEGKNRKSTGLPVVKADEDTTVQQRNSEEIESVSKELSTIPEPQLKVTKNDYDGVREETTETTQDETELSFDLDDLIESTLSNPIAMQQLQQKSCPSLVFRSRPIGQPRFTPIPNYVVPARPGPVVKPAVVEVEESPAKEEEENDMVQRFSESEGDLYQKRREHGFKDLGLLQHIETCVNIRSNLRPVGDPEVLRKAKLAEYMERFRREKPRGRKTHGLSLVDVQIKLANLRKTETRHIYGNNLQAEHHLANDGGRDDV
uniref:Uncharacterized protein n=1 Tax=Amphora coffeiformis TaxID=265554 RepID=A0A7S3L7A8_9STRA